MLLDWIPLTTGTLTHPVVQPAGLTTWVRHYPLWSQKVPTVMHHASITVAPDRSAQVTVAGQNTDHPDLGSAIAQLTRLARTSSTEVSVAIADGSALRALTVTSDGAVTSTGPQPVVSDGSGQPAPSAPEKPPEAVPAAAHAAHPETHSGSHPTTHPGTHSDTDIPTQPLAAPRAQAPADGDENGSDFTDGSGPSYPIGTPYSGPVPPHAPSQSWHHDRPEPTGTELSRSNGRGTTAPSHTQPHKNGGPKTPRQPAAEPSAGHGSSRRRAKRAGARLTVPSIVLIALLVLAGILFFLPNFIGTPSSDTSNPTQNSQAPTRAPLTLADSPTPVPGYVSQPAWEATVPQSASVTATSRGVLVVDGQDLTVIDTTDGSVRYSGEYDESITFAADTLIEGKKALVWQSGRTVQALLDGESRPIEYELPADARLSSAGTSVLIRDGNALSTLGEDELVPVPTPAPGSTPMALDGNDLISAPFDGPIVRTNIANGDETELELESPGDGLEIKLWKSAGHGLAISVWGDPGASANSGHRLQLVVHSLEDGAVTSINEVSSADIGEASWTRGQGFALASIGPYLYDMTTGLLVMDGTDSGMQFGEPRGDLVPGTLEEKPVVASGLLSDAPTAFSTNVDLLAVTDDARFAITRTGADRITAYPAG